MYNKEITKYREQEDRHKRYKERTENERIENIENTLQNIKYYQNQIAECQKKINLETTTSVEKFKAERNLGFHQANLKIWEYRKQEYEKRHPNDPILAKLLEKGKEN